MVELGGAAPLERGSQLADIGGPVPAAAVLSWHATEELVKQRRVIQGEVKKHDPASELIELLDGVPGGAGIHAASPRPGRDAYSDSLYGDLMRALLSPPASVPRL